MDLVTQFLVACLLGGFFLWKNLQSKNKNLPPGPRGLPIIGNAHQVGCRPYIKFMQWAKEYGPIFRAKMLHMKVIVISDHKLIKELFSHNEALGRMLDNPLVYEFTRGNYGIVNAEGPTWEHNRRFTLRTLRDFGFAKNSMETLILDEAHALIKWFTKLNGKPISGVRLFNAAVVNSLWRLVSGERCEWEESRPEILDASERILDGGNEAVAKGVFFIPFLRHIAPEMLGWNKFLRGVDDLNKLIEKAVKQHEETFDANNLRDFIDYSLQEIKTASDKEARYRNLVVGVFDLFFAGSETTSNSLSWALLYLAGHPHVQDKIYQEISQVLGDRFPSLSDRANMPYTEAAIAEIFRISTVVSTGIPHRMLEDLCFQGYLFPKGTTIFANLYAIHHNPDIWGDPENFRPERFLNEDGTKFVKNEALVAFAEGKRKCIGETLARDTVFLFLTSIIQKFNILPENDKPLDTEADIGYILMPKPFNVIMSLREK